MQYVKQEVKLPEWCKPHTDSQCTQTNRMWCNYDIHFWFRFNP